ncbi:DUF4127 family protein [Erysipelothrix sp. HDW6C]|uniref:DUF4127 family protein n=1 Tax=Erysipelothrix sp. HDW6C TaxID=2714930 RepID=UPI00140AAD86|nr:DUF4127 family protein [Erysipelothrix sp. HDW6C]QIK68816.1 DUF4127 family protein [Erysipelothrix sp. HDW6C]
MSKVVVLPIDDRPCHNDFIVDALRYVDNVSLVMAPKTMLGHFTNGGDVDAMASFLKTTCKDADMLIVSVDGLLYGGLVQARTAESTIDADKYKRLLDTLTILKQQNPKLKIYAYSVIMRLTTTVTDSSQLKTWESLFKYSQLVHRARIDAQFTKELHDVEATIPPKALEMYLNARKRNHAINRASVKLVAEGIIDYLVLVQEDTSEYGMHVEEQAALRALIQDLNVDNAVKMKNGTDEMVALLMARFLNQHGSSVTIDTQFVDPNYVAIFEDKPALVNLADSCDVARLTQGESENVLLVLPAKGKSIDLCFEAKPDEIQVDDAAIDAYMKYAGKPIAVLDLQFGNGGDIRSLERVMEALKPRHLIGYSAWNTGSNSIGTILLDIVIANRYHVNPEYVAMRIVDDALYQGDVRSVINQEMKSRGLDVWAENYDAAINEETTQLLNKTIQQYPFIGDYTVNAHLPWGRSFEVLIEVKKYEEV